jgi:molybdenum cofactor biosynthesis enzyme MoaA
MAKPMCSAVHHGLCITAYGAVNPCCSSSDFVHINDIENIHDYFYNGKILNDARKVEYSDQWLNECFSCRTKGEKGIVSRKDKMQQWYPYANESFTEKNTYAIIHMDISFGNSCNQKCIMCNSRFSSQWLKDDIEMIENAPYIRNWKTNYIPKNWSISYEHLDQIVDLVTEHTQKIEIKGGEPLYDKRFSYFIEKVIEKNPNIKISTNTNGTHFNDKNIEMLNKIKNINIDVSFDGTGKVFEWIRNWSWDDAVENFHRCLKEVKHHPNLNYTTMVYNVDHFEEFYNWAAKISHQYGKGITCNFTQVVTSPKFLSPEYASKERLRSGLSQIEKIIQDPEGICTHSKIFKPRLEVLHNFIKLSYDKTFSNDFYQNFEKTHDYMVNVKGWDIRDYINL